MKTFRQRERKRYNGVKKMDTKKSRPATLSIAGSDPSGGAGIQADLKTFHQFGCYGMSVVTLLTVQNTQSVTFVETMTPELVIAQLDAVLEDIKPRAAKTGALGNREVIEALAERARRFSFPLVIDPVMVSKHGTPLLEKEALESFKRDLLPCAYLVTPNIHEAGVLSGLSLDREDSFEEAAKILASFGPKAVLIKGGHRRGEAADLLYAGGKFHVFSCPRIETPHTHGTGCTYSAAVTAEIARGKNLIAAVGSAKKFITKAIETAPGFGKGSGPVNHWAPAE